MHSIQYFYSICWCRTTTIPQISRLEFYALCKYVCNSSYRIRIHTLDLLINGLIIHKLPRSLCNYKERVCSILHDYACSLQPNLCFINYISRRKFTFKRMHVDILSANFIRTMFCITSYNLIRFTWNTHFSLISIICTL